MFFRKLYIIVYTIKQEGRKMTMRYDVSATGSEFIKQPFADLAKLREVLPKGEKFKLDIINMMKVVYKGLKDEFGTLTAISLISKSFLVDMLFNKPEWHPEWFDINNEAQAKFFKAKFNENIPLITLFENIKKRRSTKKADVIIAKLCPAFVLPSMSKSFKPVKTFSKVQDWIHQAVWYLDEALEPDKGFEGDVYISKDNKEARFHVTKCAPIQICHRYGLEVTSAYLCMCDHITYHTVFPNMTFNRQNCFGVGCDHCDHILRVKPVGVTAHDEEDYGDAYKVEGGREFVREWEEKAKVIMFGSVEEWEKYRDECESKNGVGPR